jgi:hypothetical protein
MWWQGMKAETWIDSVAARPSAGDTKFTGTLRRAYDILGSLGGNLHRQIALDGVLF